MLNVEWKEREKMLLADCPHAANCNHLNRKL